MLVKIIRKFSISSPTFLQFGVACGVGLILGLASIIVSPLLVFVGLFALTFAFIIFKRPEIGLLSIITVTSGLIDYEKLPLLSFASISLHITDILLLFLLAIVLVRAFLLPGYHLNKTPLDIPVLWFFLALIISAIMAFISPSVDKSWVFRQLRPLTYYLGFFCVTNLIATKKNLLFLVNGLFLIAILASLAMVLHVVAPSIQLINTKSVELVTAGHESEGVLRSFLAADRLIYIMLFISICSLVLNIELVPRNLEIGRTIILAIGLFLTYQRNYWLTFLLMVVLLGLLINWAGKFRLIRLIMVAIGVLLITVVLQIQPFNRYLAAASQRLIWGMQSETLQQDGSTQWRVIETGYAIQSVLEHPLLGVGLGNFYRPAQKMDVEIGGYGIRWYIHNSYLWVLIDMGVIGFIPFILLYGIALIRGFKYWNKVSDPMFSVILLGGSLGIFGQAIGNVVAPNFFQSWMVIVFVATLAINELIIKWEFSPSKVLE